MRRSIFVLGAGFSKPAGLPLGTDLFSEVASLADEKHRDTCFDSPLCNRIREFERYKQKAHFKYKHDEPIDIEDFVSFFDLRSKLQLLGGSRYQNHGNRNQYGSFEGWFRYYLAWAIHLAQKSANYCDLALYREFVQRLKPGDVIVTFNYDTLLESILDELGISYRFRLNCENGDPRKGSVNRPEEEESQIVILKVHGSIDWFDKGIYDNCKYCAAFNITEGKARTAHRVFSSHRFELEPLAAGEGSSNDPLLNIHRIGNVDDYFDENTNMGHDIPFVIAPSHHKLFYMDPIIEFWQAFGDIDDLAPRIAIIGYSLPKYDEYARLALYHLLEKCVEFGNLRTSIRVVDWKSTNCDISRLKENYCFLDWDKTDCYFDGFNMEAIEMIFNE